MFRQFRKYEFRKVSQILFFAVLRLFRKICKVSQIRVSQGYEFANRFFVSQVSVTVKSTEIVAALDRGPRSFELKASPVPYVHPEVFHCLPGHNIL